MTREEAINNLESLYNEVYNEDSDGYIYAEAIDMAIEALSADVVSRDVYDKRTQIDEKIIDSYRQEFQKALSAVVRCKDCRRNNDGNLCDIAYYINEDGDGFCNCGERREP